MVPSNNLNSTSGYDSVCHKCSAGYIPVLLEKDTTSFYLLENNYTNYSELEYGLTTYPALGCVEIHNDNV